MGAAKVLGSIASMILIIINILVVIIGIIVLGFFAYAADWTRKNFQLSVIAGLEEEATDEATDDLESLATSLYHGLVAGAVFGTLLTLCGILGIVGAAMKSKCLLITYVIIFALLFITQAVILGYVALYKNNGVVNLFKAAISGVYIAQKKKIDDASVRGKADTKLKTLCSIWEYGVENNEDYKRVGGCCGFKQFKYDVDLLKISLIGYNTTYMSNCKGVNTVNPNVKNAKTPKLFEDCEKKKTTKDEAKDCTTAWAESFEQEFSDNRVGLWVILGCAIIQVLAMILAIGIVVCAGMKGSGGGRK